MTTPQEPTNHSQAAQENIWWDVDKRLSRFADYIRHHDRTGLGGLDNQNTIRKELLQLIELEASHREKIAQERVFSMFNARLNFGSPGDKRLKQLKKEFEVKRQSLKEKEAK